jgi:hypothetical protein
VVGTAGCFLKRIRRRYSRGSIGENYFADIFGVRADDKQMISISIITLT